MLYPNKIFVLEQKGENEFGHFHFVIVVAASDSDLAKKHVEEKIGITAEPIWLMNAVYPTIYSSAGTTPLKEQVKILSNNNFHI